MSEHTEPYIDECGDVARMEAEIMRLRTVEAEHKLVTGERDRLLLERAQLQARIGELEKKLATCAAGPWREIGYDDGHSIDTIVMASDGERCISARPSDPHTWRGKIKYVRYIATINPLESNA